jgi:glycosyltransferase involved in cell wall biosynthesis
VRHARPDIVHVFGLTLDINLALLVRAAKQAEARVVVHFHGGVPSTGRRIRHLQRRTLARVERVLFTHPEQARPWIDAGVLPGWERVGQVIETSVDLTPPPRESARAITAMHGDPVCLSVGRLHPIKDPATMLRGFLRIAAARPAARLYLYYLSDELLPDLRALLAEQPELAARIEFRGPAAAKELPAIYASGDFLLQASLREWSSLAVLEALACGRIPIVTNIPAFEKLTQNGRYGRLFPPGDDAALAEAVLALDEPARLRLSQEAREYFARELSFAAMARQIDALYRELHESKPSQRRAV